MALRRVFSPEGRRDALRFLLPRLSLVLLVTTLVIYGVAMLPGVPYHVQALFGPRPSLSQTGLFAVIVLFALTPPAYFGLQLVRGVSRMAWLFPVAILLHAVIVFLAFRYATPIASVHDLLGFPLWGIGDELERAIRFVALFISVSVPFAGGSAVLYALTGSYAPRRLLWWLLFAAVLLGLAYQVIVVHAATTNVTALLPADLTLFGALGVALWLALLAFVGSVLAARLAGVLAGTFAAGLTVAVMLPLSYALISVATGQHVGGPGSSLSALAFLLSAESGQYQFTTTGLFMHYAAAYGVVVVLLTCSQYPLWVSYATRRFQTPLALVASLRVDTETPPPG